MLVPQSHPCDQCGHARGDHVLSHFGEECIHCGCTATWEQRPIVITNDERSSARLMPFMVPFHPAERPRFVRDEILCEIEEIVRALWLRNLPRSTPVTGDLARDNAEAERSFEKIQAMTHALWFLGESDACFTVFPEAEHLHLRRIRELFGRLRMP